MPVYQAPIEDTLFILHDVLNIEKYGNIPAFSEATPDLIKAVLEEGAKLCEEVLQPLNQVGDREGCTRHEDGSVTTPTGFKDAYKAFSEGGWGGLSVDEKHGGQGLPHFLAAIFNEYVVSANMSFGMYPGLTRGAMAAIIKHGTDEQKTTYLPKMVTGEWSGTMNLTESHCGTDLGLLRTKAALQDDGSYKISGTKIFISAGDHDLTDNIIHLVLARIEGAPDGMKGISLFIVPRNNFDADGVVGENNGVSCGSLEEKMGIHGNSTCLMNYDDATGYLIGEENKGMRAMFTMMNDARLGVGIQGLGISEVAYQNAAAYARDRLQGRALTGAKEPEKAADPIIVHPDVRRMLMNMKSFNEGARAFVAWAAINGDIAERSEDEAERQKADDLLALLTPVIKGVLTDTGFMTAVNAQQVYGGHGYIAEWGMEQFVRDARIAMIYEGANGVQALDLVGRKLAANGGRSLMTYFGELDALINANKDDEKIGEIVAGLKKGRDDLEAATGWFMQNAMANPDNAGAGSTDYMHLLGLVALGHMWVMMAKAASDKLAEGGGNEEFLKNKLVTARYFMERMMPETGAHLARISTGSETMMALDAEAF
ncbi:MAG: acyl-CoA dehydrogenase C-terminal domain-containing protein [Rhizobiales bacterium]|nr:acyl-CoA dehydrogenase C-terminal domain-containing protein [Hyphomicrobiales bacterium]